jgi:hypothetical protein
MSFAQTTANKPGSEFKIDLSSAKGLTQGSAAVKAIGKGVETKSQGMIWGSPTPVDDSRKQSTTPQNALRGLPNQRPVQLFTLDPSRYIGPNALPLPKEKTRTFDKVPPTHLQKAINFCAEVGKRGCAAFEDETFRKFCGICVASEEEPGGVAGLYISEEDRDRQTDQQGRPYKDIRPTFGTCPRNSFTVERASCEGRRAQEQCLLQQSRDPRVVNLLDPARRVPKNCAVCAETGEINLFPKRSDASSTELLLGGRGQIRVTVGSRQIADGNLADGMRINMTGVTEGTLLTMDVGVSSSTASAEVAIANEVALAGVLIGPTARGPYTIDISKLATIDEVSGLAPRRQGFINIEGDINNRVLRVVPATGKQSIRIVLRIPMTFVDGREPAAAACAASPVLRTADSIRELGMEVCRNPASAPGNYSVDCLKYLWVVNGCTAEGAGYPRDLKRAPALLWDDAAKPRDLRQINDHLKNIAAIAQSGVDADGRAVRTAERDAAISFCLGARGGPASAPGIPMAAEQTVRIPPPALPEPAGLKARVQGRPPTIRGWFESAAQAFNGFMAGFPAADRRAI